MPMEERKLLNFRNKGIGKILMACPFFAPCHELYYGTEAKSEGAIGGILMLAYGNWGIIGESLCKDENDRNAVAEMKHKYANRSEVFNNRFGKNAYIFIADTSEGSITLGAFVTDLQKISAIVDSYAQHMGIQMTDIVISEATLKKLYGLLRLKVRIFQDTNEILEEFRLDEIVGDYVRYLEYKEYIVKKGTANLLRCNERLNIG